MWLSELGRFRRTTGSKDPGPQVLGLSCFIRYARSQVARHLCGEEEASLAGLDLVVTFDPVLPRVPRDMFTLLQFFGAAGFKQQESTFIDPGLLLGS